MNPIIEKRFEYKGHPCVIMFMPWHCCRCGYIGISPEAPVFANEIECHGGITYDNDELFGQGDKYIRWLGFDCCHAGDIRDVETGKKYLANDPEKLEHLEWLAKFDRRFGENGEIRTVEYCESECKKMIDQIEGEK